MKVKVFVIPRNHEYINRLGHSLNKAGIRVKNLKPFHYSTPMNILRLLFFRMAGYRIVHVHWLYIFPFAFVMKWFYFFCKVLGIRIIWEMHNIVPHSCKERDIKNARWFHEKAHAIIFHSKSDIERSREMLGAESGKMHIIIPHGNFSGSYENTVSKKEARKLLSIPAGMKVILCFGFIRKNRGYEYLIEAVKGMEDVVVVIAGKILESETYHQLVEYARGNANLKLFAKWVENSEVQFYFNACDIVVLPYTHITTSGVIPLAYSFSRPVITTNIGGIKGVVINESTGLLVSPEDAKALREAIERLFSLDFEKMGRYAREYAEKEFSWDSNARKIKELYLAVLTGNFL